MIYNSIIPTKMTNDELRAICGDIQTAKNWGLNEATIQLSNGQQYKVDVNRHQDYQKEFKTYIGS